jgi:hypothetical protein
MTSFLTYDLLGGRKKAAGLIGEADLQLETLDEGKRDRTSYRRREGDWSATCLVEREQMTCRQASKGRRD